MQPGQAAASRSAGPCTLRTLGRLLRAKADRPALSATATAASHAEGRGVIRTVPVIAASTMAVSTQAT